MGTEPDKDLAVLKLSKKGPGRLFPIAVGNSQQLEVMPAAPAHRLMQLPLDSTRE